MTLLLELWPAIAILTYTGSALAGLGYSAVNTANSWRSLTWLQASRLNGPAQEAARGMLRVNLALLGGQFLEGLLVLATLGNTATGSGRTTDRGVLFSLILIGVNLCLSLASVASANSWRRVRRYVAKEGT